MIPHSPLEARLKSTFEHSREVVRRAHQRAESAIERAQRMREGLRRVRAAVPEGADGRKLSLLELAVEESARSLREKEHFIAVLAHELRQPLNAALAAARVASVSASPEVIHRARAVIERQLLQLAILLEDLSEVSRLTLRQGDLRREPVSIRDVLSAAAESVQVRAADKGVTLNVTLPPDACVDGDGGRLYQVFANLLANAVRYTPRGGTVTVTSAIAPETVVITVSDTGSGIEPEYLPHIFEPFARGGQQGGEGFGIGLALVRSIVELHGGSVTATSSGTGLGSVFEVRLPLAPTSPPAAG